MMDEARSRRAWRAVLVGLIVLIVGIGLVNAIRHDPYTGYDAIGYVRYIRTLAEGRLPLATDSAEFFTPPLSFAAPALLLRLGLDEFTALKGAQLVNVLLSLGTLVLLARVGLRLFPGRECLAVASIAFLGLLPVYHKSLAFVRAEPYLMFFTAAVLERVLEASAGRSLRSSLVVGVLLGAALLSRQWGFFLVPVLSIWCLFSSGLRRERLWAAAKFMVGAMAVAAVVAGWFYVSLWHRHGTPAAFNRPPAERFSLSNQPRSFYLGHGGRALFSSPVRNAFRNQLLPILYSETWGDYWEYFVVYGWDAQREGFVSGEFLHRRLAAGGVPAGLETNHFEMAPYLGRVNLVSLVPSAVGLLGWVLAKATTLRAIRREGWSSTPLSEGLRLRILALASFVVIVSLCGYLWFLIQFPDLAKGGTIKATYLLHLMPSAALLAGYGVERISRRIPHAFWAILGSFAIVFVHNLGAMVSRYPRW